jgi:hypothetical protein
LARSHDESLFVLSSGELCAIDLARDADYSWRMRAVLRFVRSYWLPHLWLIPLYVVMILVQKGEWPYILIGIWVSAGAFWAGVDAVKRRRAKQDLSAG